MIALALEPGRPVPAPIAWLTLGVLGVSAILGGLSMQAHLLDAADLSGALGLARELLSRGAGTQATYDNALAAAVAARSGLAQAKAQLDFQRQQVGVLQADVAVAEAALVSAEAALNTARIALQDTRYGPRSRARSQAAGRGWANT